MEIVDDGFVTLKIGGVTASFDLYLMNNRLAAMQAEARQKFPGEDGAAQATVLYLDGVCAILAEMGFGQVSHRAADKFDDAVFEKVEELKKSDAPTPA